MCELMCIPAVWCFLNYFSTSDVMILKLIYPDRFFHVWKLFIEYIVIKSCTELIPVARRFLRNRVQWQTWFPFIAIYCLLFPPSFVAVSGLKVFLYVTGMWEENTNTIIYWNYFLQKSILVDLNVFKSNEEILLFVRLLFHYFLALVIHSILTYTNQRWKIMFIVAYLYLCPLQLFF